MENIGLYKEANNLLRKRGYSADGSKLRDSSKNQKFFERFTVIKTPMGNHR